MQMHSHKEITFGLTITQDHITVTAICQLYQHLLSLLLLLEMCLKIKMLLSTGNLNSTFHNAAFTPVTSSFLLGCSYKPMYI